MWRLLQDVRGHTGIEYAMIAAFVALGIVAALGDIGGYVQNMYAALQPAFATTP